MKTIGLLLLFSFFQFIIHAQDVALLNSQNKSLTYDQTIAFYQNLSDKYPAAKLITEGLTDIGRPLHLFIMSNDQSFDPTLAHSRKKTIVLINNGIHPGEPDGIDASARLARSYLEGKVKFPDNIVLCIIPVYNIGGSLKSGCCSRANQDGPEDMGFRGSAQNLDLNRDFIKCDSENTRSFTKIFREWNPDVFIDTHVSNGADYQYTMTLINTQYQKLGGAAGVFLKQEMTPALFRRMSDEGHEMAPYVNTKKYDDPPETGIYAFNETPRFASGYAALFGSLAFVPETHMLKPFPQRVEATLKLLEIIIGYTSENADQIRFVREKANNDVVKKMDFTLSWESDTTQFELVPFRGYEAEYRTSKVTGIEQLYYNREKPFVKPIKFFDEYQPLTIVTRPEYYILPQAWKNVVDRLELNMVDMARLVADTILEVETYVIDDYKTVAHPYEGHYLHHSVVLKTEIKKMQYYKGDYVIPLNQESNRYIVETMEPQAPDSWFAWGFFDAILQQKEWFSAYVFDGLAEKILEENPELRKEFVDMKSRDPDFAASSHAQLYYIYKNSKYFEDFKRYPVGRLMRK